MDNIERRAFMRGAAIGALAFTVGDVEVLLTPSEARAQNVAHRTLSASEVETLEALGARICSGSGDWKRRPGPRNQEADPERASRRSGFLCANVEYCASAWTHGIGCGRRFGTAVSR